MIGLHKKSAEKDRSAAKLLVSGAMATELDKRGLSEVEEDIKFGRMLVRRGLIQSRQLVEAVRFKIDAKLPLPVCLVRLGFLKRQDIGKVLNALAGPVRARRPFRRS